jgi:hypothetical protein
MKRSDAGCLGLRMDQAAICLANSSKILIEIADKAMYSGQEEVEVPDEVIGVIRDCARKLDVAVDEFTSRVK